MKNSPEGKFEHKQKRFDQQNERGSFLSLGYSTMTFDVDQSILQGVRFRMSSSLSRISRYVMYFTCLIDYFILERDTDILFSDVLVDDIRNIFVDEYVFD